MLCNWCDEPIVMETGDYKLVSRRRYVRKEVLRDGKSVGYKGVGDSWDEEWFHDYCFEDGTRGEDVTEDAQGELMIL